MAAKSKTLPQIKRTLIKVRIKGISPLIQHHWAQKALDEIRAAEGGRKTKNREPRNPVYEGLEAGYLRCKNQCHHLASPGDTKPPGVPGVLACAIKGGMIEAAHTKIGIDKVLVRKSLFIVPMGRHILVPLETAEGKGHIKPDFTEDFVKVQGKATLRYRPYYYDWACTTTWEVDTELLKLDDFLKLLDRAGFGVGLNEWRPQKGGEYGRYEVDTDYKVEERVIRKR